MKSFLRFLVMLIVVGVILFETYYLVRESRMFTIYHPETNNTENNCEMNNKTDEPETTVPQVDNTEGEKESAEPHSETYSSKEALIDITNRTAERNISENAVDTIQDRVGREVVGSKYDDLFTYLETDTTSCTIQVAGTMIYIMPASDFLDNQQFHFDENGNLILYVVEGAGTGFVTRYYFMNGELVTKTADDVGEVLEQAQPESGEQTSGEQASEELTMIDNTDINDILERAKYLYDEYLKKEI